MKWALSLVTAVAAAGPGLAADAPPEPVLYTHSATLALPSAGEPDWDYLALDPATGRLYVARHDDGLTVVDTAKEAVVGQVENGTGANGPVIVGKYHRGFAAMTDGTALVFDTRSLKAIARPKLDPQGREMDSATYDPASDHVIIASGRREEHSTWYVLDAASGRKLAERDFASTKMDHPAFDGKGSVFAPFRDQNVILRLNSSDLTEARRYTLGACIEPSVLEMRAGSPDLMVACRGPHPVFIALDTVTGAVKAQFPIGPHADGMAIDEARRRIVIATGDNAQLRVIGFGPEGYTDLGTVGTEPMARTMQMDPRSGRVFTVTADYTWAAPEKDEAAPEEPYFHPGSFRVLTYTPAP